jgi:pyrimidine oxygenase
MPKTSPDIGLFLPIANGGWIISENTPRIDGGYELNRRAAMLAEQFGFDFLLSMMKWRGFGGKTNHWGTCLESMMLMSALSQVTSRVKLWATVHILLQNPAVAAKMIATLDHVSQGRAGLNIVSGAFQSEIGQMGMWRPELDHDQRYDLAREWIEAILRLWSEPRVDVDGTYYKLEDCVSDPKPLSKPRPDLICAGMSEAGLRFTARYADAAFVGGDTEAAIGELSRRAKGYAAEHGKSLKTYAMCVLIPGATDTEAEARLDHFIAGTDHEAVKGVIASFGLRPGGKEKSIVTRSRQGFMATRLVGGAASLRQQIEEVLNLTGLDGLMFIFPDYVEDLRFFGEHVLPGLRAGLPAGQAA